MKFFIHRDEQSDDDMRALIFYPGRVTWSALGILSHCVAGSRKFNADLSYFYEHDAATAKFRAQKAFQNLIEEGLAICSFESHPAHLLMRGEKTLHIFTDPIKCEVYAKKLKRLLKNKKIHSYKCSSKFPGGQNG